MNELEITNVNVTIINDDVLEVTAEINKPQQIVVIISKEDIVFQKFSVGDVVKVIVEAKDITLSDSKER
ncbi:MAG: hypothetical protein ACP6IU_04665 [Candidatus Asgardarchaeia archaeon]